MLTLTQLYNLGVSQSVDIFDGLNLPFGSPLDRDTLINTIMVQCGLNIPMYADPFVMRSAVNIWSAKNQYTFKHIAKIYTAEYSPIENTDRYDSITVEHDRALNDNSSSTNVKKDNASLTNITNDNKSSTNLVDENLNTSSTTENDSTSEHTGTDTNTVEETTSAYNSSDYVPNTNTTSELEHGETITDNATTETNGNSNKSTSASENSNKSTSISETSNKSESVLETNTKEVNEDEKTTTTQHLHGNIGTTTNTLLQSEEYSLLKDYNPYTFIAGLFENELTLCVY